MKSILLAMMLSQSPAVTDNVIVIDTTFAEPGRYIYVLDIDKFGKATLSRATNVFNVTAKPNDPIEPDKPNDPVDPIDPIDPIDPDPNMLPAKIDIILKELPKEEYANAKVIASLYKQVSKWISSGKLKTYQETILTLRTPRTLALVGKGKEWESITKQFDTLDSLTLPKLKIVYDIIASKLEQLK